jgi:lipid-binding SYLF domain-containing protein
MRNIVFTLLASLLALPALGAEAANREDARILTANQVLTEMQAMPDVQAPEYLLRRAQGIAIIPSVIKLGAGIGGRGGKGVLLVRDAATGHWSNPSFVTLYGGSFGFQFGVQSSDIVLVFTTRKSVEGISDGKLTLGADASAAAGPVGRQASGATDIGFDAEVYAYSRAKGLFAGVSFDGTVIAIDGKANARYYGKSGVLASDIFASRMPVSSASGTELVGLITRLTQGETRKAAAAPAAAPIAPPAPMAPVAPAAAAPTEARTFPLEGGAPSGQ